MRLESIEYTEHRGSPHEWSLQGLELGPLNLIVGKNATGKTKALNVIHSLARLLTGKSKPSFFAGYCDVRFDHNGQALRYILGYGREKFTQEEFYRGDEKLLERGKGGIGKLYHEREGRALDFQTPEDELAAVVRQDSLQHGFLRPLSDWANRLFLFRFGNRMGKDPLCLPSNGATDGDLSTRDDIVEVFHIGQEEYPQVFEASIREDMGAIGYSLDQIGLVRREPVMVGRYLPAHAYALWVKEKDLTASTLQFDMSSGMFRALSILIHLEYALLSGRPSCILIDDIGEGLDFDRSCALIELLMAKATRSQVQLVMSTNDRFVMNKVPLKAWSVLQRQGGTVRVRNYQNSRAIFDEFEFTGLSNFDFLATDFVNEEAAIHEEAGGVR